MNYRFVKYLQRNIVDYKFCLSNILKFDWNDSVLQIIWLQRVKTNLSRKSFWEKIKNSNKKSNYESQYEICYLLLQ